MTQIEWYQLTPALNISRILNGMWQVVGVIVGARLGLSEHKNDNARVFDLITMISKESMNFL